MNKIFLLSTVLLATTVASRAAVDLRIGIPLPPLPRVIIGAPAPRVIVREEAACTAPVVVAPAVPCAPPPPVICAPPPRVVYVPSHGYYSHGRSHGWEYRHDRYDCYSHR